MEYNVKIGSKSYKLPKYTTQTAKMCDEVIAAGNSFNKHEISVEELLDSELAFLDFIFSEYGDFVAQQFGSDTSEMDIHEVDSLCCDVVFEYQRPNREKKQKEMEAQLDPLKKILSNKNFAAALSAAVSNSSGSPFSV